MGELGGEFAKGFLRCGYPVVPVLRGMSLEQTAGEVPSPVLVVVTVAEAICMRSWPDCQRAGVQEPLYFDLQ